jgi:hypothetical protein
MPVACGLLKSRSKPRSVHKALFHNLHPHGQDLIRSWAQRGIAKADEHRPASDFEAFIYLWIALNGWGACVANTDNDTEWVNALAVDPNISKTFQKLLDDDQGFRQTGEAFAARWPIFKASEIRRQQILVSPDQSRPERIRDYLTRRISCEPKCWKDHGGRPPLDWPHTLASLYRVRNNLFHGEKTLDSVNDRAIVAAACSVLALFVQKGELFR